MKTGEQEEGRSKEKQENVVGKGSVVSVGDRKGGRTGQVWKEQEGEEVVRREDCERRIEDLEWNGIPYVGRSSWYYSVMKELIDVEEEKGG